MIKPLFLLFWLLSPITDYISSFNLEFSGLKSEVIYEIDNSHTAILTKVNRFQMVDVIGRFTNVKGKITIASDGQISDASITIEANSYIANNADGENAVKGPAFLNASKYPKIEFELDRVIKESSNLKALGKLTIHGITNEIHFPFEMRGPFKDPTGLNSVSIKAKLAINRKDYGIMFDRKMTNGESLIGDMVEIELYVLATEM